MEIKVRVEKENLVKSGKRERGIKEEEEEVELNAFDTVTYKTDFSIIFTFRAPTVCNRAMEQGLVRALAEYPEWAGRLCSSSSSILVNDRGVLLVEAACDSPLIAAVQSYPTPDLLHLHGARAGEDDEDDPLLHVQLTRFSCGGLAVGITASHVIADGGAACWFWIRWGRAVRGLSLPPRRILDRKMISPRSPPKIQFEHKGVEYDVPSAPKAAENSSAGDKNETIVEKVHFSAKFLKKLIEKASSSSISSVNYTTFEALTAHLWRTVTEARGLEDNVETRMRISVNGRRRMKPQIPDDYLGNLVLWAFPAASALDLRSRPLDHAAELIREAVTKLDDGYFRSFVDFSENLKTKKGEERLSPTAEMENRVLSPHLEVDSWLRLPFYDVDFGSGPPDLFTPTWLPYEGYLILLPSTAGDSGIDVLVTLFRDTMMIFKEICYTLN